MDHVGHGSVHWRVSGSRGSQNMTRCRLRRGFASVGIRVHSPHRANPTQSVAAPWQCGLPGPTNIRQTHRAAFWLLMYRRRRPNQRNLTTSICLLTRIDFPPHNASSFYRTAAWHGWLICGSRIFRGGDFGNPSERGERCEHWGGLGLRENEISAFVS